MAQNELKRLLPRHYKILSLCLEGFRRTDIAEALGMSPVGVGLIINSPLFQDELARQRVGKNQDSRDIAATQDLDAMNILQKAASAAAQKHVDLLQSTNERTSQLSANSILDRVLSREGSVATKLDANVINILQVTIKELQKDEFRSCAPPIERADVDLAENP